MTHESVPTLGKVTFDLGHLPMLPLEGMDGYDPYGEDTSGFFSSIGHALSHAVKPLGKVVKVIATPITAPAHLIAKATHNIPILGSITGAADSLNSMPFKVTQQVIEGGNISKVALSNFKEALSNVKTLGPYAQTIISFVPGIGTGVAAAIGAGLALADGKPISEALLAAVKGSLPGGAIAQTAFNVSQAAIQGKPIDQIAIAALPISDSQKTLLAQGLSAAKDIAAGKNVAHSIVDHAIKTLPPTYAKAVQIGMAMGHAKNLQDALKTGAKGAVSMGASTLLKTAGAKVNPFINAAKTLGSSQAGIQKAMGAAQAIKNGSPVLQKALSGAVSHFASGSAEHIGFSTAVNVLKQTAGNKVALGVARRNLPNEAARHAFDAAIGVVSHTVTQNPGALAKRAGSAFVPNLYKKKGIISPYQPNLKNAIDSIRRNPTLASQHPMVLANKFGTTQQTVLQALRHVGTQSLLPWRSLSPRAANFVRKWHPNAPLSALTHGTHNTAGLDESGTKYIVAKGDSPFSIAQKLTGNGNNWTQLKALNTDKKPDITKNVWVGEVLNIPPSWQKPTAKQPSPAGPAVPTQPSIDRPAVITTPAPQVSTAPGILQAKAILVAWSKTDGVNQAGVSDYGSTAADLSTDFGPRDSLELQAFQNWDNKFGSVSPKLAVDGKLGPKSLSALQQWAEQRATQAAPVPQVVTSIPGQVTTLPEVVIEATPPVSPGIPQLNPAPPSGLPVVINTPIATTPVVPAIPPVATPAQPATPASIAAAQPASSGSKMGPAIAGAAVGGVLFGLPGALIGGIAGAAIA